MKKLPLPAYIAAALIPWVSSCKVREYNQSNALQNSASGNGQALDNMIRANQFAGPATAYEDFSKDGGGCGPTEKMIAEDTRDQVNGILAYAALNVGNTPGDHSEDPILRARPNQKNALLGMFQSGKNCGRWVEATIPWEGKTYKGKFIVADSCYDPNGWCRDYPGHIDLSVYQLVYTVTGKKMDQTVRGRGWPINWPNSQVTWKFIDTPNYKGPIRIYFAKRAQRYWPTIIITNLKNGLGGVLAKSGSTWVEARMDSDRGQVYVLPTEPTKVVTDANGKVTAIGYQIKIRDYNSGDWNKDIFEFEFPEACFKTNPDCPEIMPAKGVKIL